MTRPNETRAHVYFSKISAAVLLAAAALLSGSHSDLLLKVFLRALRSMAWANSDCWCLRVLDSYSGDCGAQITSFRGEKESHQSECLCSSWCRFRVQM